MNFPYSDKRRQIDVQHRPASPRHLEEPIPTSQIRSRRPHPRIPRRRRVDDVQPQRPRRQYPVKSPLVCIIESSTSHSTFESEVDASDSLGGAAARLFSFPAPSTTSRERRQLGGRGFRHRLPLGPLYTPSILGGALESTKIAETSTTAVFKSPMAKGRFLQ